MAMNTTIKTNFTIQYEAVHPSTNCTDCLFFDCIADIFATFKNNTQQSYIFVTDSNVVKLQAVDDFLKTQKLVHILPAGEAHKTIDSVLEILKKALEHNATRKTTFVGIGGGVICDITAFAASLFKRGAQLELVPTTLLAMGDAAIGGKTGCDFLEYKNMVGSFFPAKTLYVSEDFMQTQSEKEFFSGLAEVVKTALLYDKELFTLLQTKQKNIMLREKNILRSVVQKCMYAKAKIVEQDLTEQNIRMQLNLGHTFAHALETCSGLGVFTHGEAVAWGIGRATALAKKLGLCDNTYYETVFSLLKSYNWDTTPIPHSPNKLTVENLIMAMKKDKKNASSTIRIILQKNLCDTLIMDIDDSHIATVLNNKQ